MQARFDCCLTTVPDTQPLIDPTSAADPADATAAQAPVAPEQLAGDGSPAEDTSTDALPAQAPADLPDDAPAPAAAPAIPALSPAACAAKLAELFPAVFTVGLPKPLKLRIQADIQERVPATFTRKVLSLFLQRHTTGTAYLRALSQQPERVDLDGNPAGAVSDEHREAAAAELTRRRSLHEERRAAERQAQRQAQEEARRQYVEEDQARRDRAGLLRAFEGSTLTRSNFCALKNVPEATLDAVLAQARQEREQFPPAARTDRPEARPERAPGRPDQRPAPRGDRGERPDNRGPGRSAERRPGGPNGPRGPQRRGPATPKPGT